MAQLLDIAPEVLHSILLEVEPPDLASLSRCCRMLLAFITHDALLWKTQYLERFDYPMSIDEPVETFWKGKLSKLIKIQKILESSDPSVKGAHLAAVTSTAIELLDTCPVGSGPSLNNAFCTRFFHQSINASHFLSRSSLFKHAGYNDIGPASTEYERQLSARLHVLYGISLEPQDDEIGQSVATAVHPFARSRVYDLRRYTDHNFWGPFLDDGSQGIDWEKVQAIMVVLAHNLQTLRERIDGKYCYVWNKPFVGLAEDSFVPRMSCLEKQPRPPLDAQDPYGVSGTWMRIVCFLDYNNLYSFNFESDAIHAHQERGPITTEEAIRLIYLKLEVSKIESPDEEDAQDMPVVHFRGSSRSMHLSWDPNANSKIRGTVRTTPSGAIRWTSFSIYYGEERWRSEGVQIGGRRSERGILGTWFDKDYDEHGPAGPSAFWKLSDDVLEGKQAIAHPFPFTAFF